MHEARERTGIPVLYCTEYRYRSVRVRYRYPVQYRTVPVALLQYRLGAAAGEAEGGGAGGEVGGDRAGDGSPGGCARAWGWLRECGGRGVCVRVNVRCVWLAFVCCCFACDCVLELVVCRVRFARACVLSVVEI